MFDWDHLDDIKLPVYPYIYGLIMKCRTRLVKTAPSESLNGVKDHAKIKKWTIPNDRSIASTFWFVNDLISIDKLISKCYCTTSRSIFDRQRTKLNLRGVFTCPIFGQINGHTRSRFENMILWTSIAIEWYKASLVEIKTTLGKLLLRTFQAFGRIWVTNNYMVSLAQW